MSLDLDEHYDKIYRYCYFKVSNKELAEDLTQEAFLKYFAQTSYISKGKPLAYLYTIAKNLCTDYYKKAVCAPLDEALAAKDELSVLETNLAVKQAVAGLPHELQEILLLRYVNELSIGEIANVAAVSRFAIYRRINAALTTLKTTLKKEDFP